VVVCQSPGPGLESKFKNFTQRREDAKKPQSFVLSPKWQDDLGKTIQPLQSLIKESIILPLNYFAFILFAHSLRLCAFACALRFLE
jgi:hypothetical protein